MYITDKYVLIHMNKTACTTVKDFMIQHLGAKVHKYKHAPIRMLDSKHHDKIKIGVIRNPFDWYVSYYKYLTQNKVLTTMDFPQFLFTYTEHPRALFDFMGMKIRRKYENLYPPKTKLKIGSWTFHYINYFSYEAKRIFGWSPKYWEYQVVPIDESSYCEIFEENDTDVLMRTETLKEDMIKVFGEEHRESITSFPRKNVSTRKPYQEYYTPELRSRVEERDGILMEYLNYEYK